MLYDAPSVKSDRVFVATRHYPLEVLVKLDAWTKVRDVNGEVAWVENRQLGERREECERGVRLHYWTVGVVMISGSACGCCCTDCE